MSDAEESAESVHPWPYLSEIFAYKSKAGNRVKLICLLCAPKCIVYFAKGEPRNVECCNVFCLMEMQYVGAQDKEIAGC